MTIQRIRPGARMSAAVVHGQTIYLAGQVADKTAGKSVAEQTAEILSIIDDLLKEAGSDKTKILSVNIYLTDISTFAEMNSVWDQWVPKGHPPARATIEAKLAAPAYKVEIMAVAAKD
ncbi:MAG: RidA family protein [Alphaproteobacteria bacterium]|nr:RidA family protein [Alphaproteobacteria bacterium]